MALQKGGTPFSLKVSKDKDFGAGYNTQPSSKRRHYVRDGAGPLGTPSSLDVSSEKKKKNSMGLATSQRSSSKKQQSQSRTMNERRKAITPYGWQGMLINSAV